MNITTPRPQVCDVYTASVDVPRAEVDGTRQPDERLLAAAMCYLAAADPATLDPDGSAVGWMWPYEREFDPAGEPVVNLKRACEAILTLILQHVGADSVPHVAA